MSLVFGRTSLVFSRDPSVAESCKLTAESFLPGTPFAARRPRLWKLTFAPTHTLPPYAPAARLFARPGQSHTAFRRTHPIRPPWPIRPAKAGRKPAIGEKQAVSYQLSANSQKDRPTGARVARTEELKLKAES